MRNGARDGALKRHALFNEPPDKPESDATARMMSFDNGQFDQPRIVAAVNRPVGSRLHVKHQMLGDEVSGNKTDDARPARLRRNAKIAFRHGPDAHAASDAVSHGIVRLGRQHAAVAGNQASCGKAGRHRHGLGVGNHRNVGIKTRSKDTLAPQSVVLSRVDRGHAQRLDKIDAAFNGAPDDMVDVAADKDIVRRGVVGAQTKKAAVGRRRRPGKRGNILSGRPLAHEDCHAAPQAIDQLGRRT